MMARIYYRRPAARSAPRSTPNVEKLGADHLLRLLADKARSEAIMREPMTEEVHQSRLDILSWIIRDWTRVSAVLPGYSICRHPQNLKQMLDGLGLPHISLEDTSDTAVATEPPIRKSLRARIQAVSRNRISPAFVIVAAPSSRKRKWTHRGLGLIRKSSRAALGTDASMSRMSHSPLRSVSDQLGFHENTNFLRLGETTIDPQHHHPSRIPLSSSAIASNPSPQVIFSSQLIPRTFSATRKFELMQLFRHEYRYIIPACLYFESPASRDEGRTFYGSLLENHDRLISQSVVVSQPPPKHTLAHRRWPSDLPVELYESITKYLSRKDVASLRLVCKETNHRLSGFFQRVVVPFRVGTWDVSDAGPSGEASTERILRHWGSHIQKFAYAFDFDESALNLTPTKFDRYDTRSSFHGTVIWPKSAYIRYRDRARLELAADKRGRMEQTLLSLVNATELGLALDNGLGYLKGADISQRAWKSNEKVHVFGARYVKDDSVGNKVPASSSRYLGLPAAQILNQYVRILDRAPRRGIGLFAIIANYILANPVGELEFLSADPVANPTTYVNATCAADSHASAFLQEISVWKDKLDRWATLGNLGELLEAAVSINKKQRLSEVSDNRKIENFPELTSFWDRYTRYLATRSDTHQVDSDVVYKDGRRAVQSQIKIEAQPIPPGLSNSDIMLITYVNRNLIARLLYSFDKVDVEDRAMRGSNLEFLLQRESFASEVAREFSDDQDLSEVYCHPLKPNRLNERQKEWLIETDWAQRGFVNTFVLSIFKCKASLINIRTLTMAQIPSQYLSTLSRSELWCSLQSLENLTLLVSPAWRDIVIDAAGTHDCLLRPSESAQQMYALLVSIQRWVRKLNILKVGYTSGGEHETGIYARNQHVMPAPVLDSSPDGKLLILPGIERVAFVNCWFPAQSLAIWIESMTHNSLQHLTLDSVSLVIYGGRTLSLKVGWGLLDRSRVLGDDAPRSIGYDIPEPNSRSFVSAGGQPGAHPLFRFSSPLIEHDTWATTRGTDAWMEVLERISPGCTLLSQLQHLPSDTTLFATKKQLLKSITLKSCGYVELPFQNLDSAILGTAATPTAQVAAKKEALKSHVMSSGDDAFSARILPHVLAEEARRLQDGFGMRIGWGGDPMAQHNLEDGHHLGGAGRFSGAIIAPPRAPSPPPPVNPYVVSA